MAEFGTYGIDFPFQDSELGYYLRLTETPEEEIKADLIHLIINSQRKSLFFTRFRNPII